MKSTKTETSILYWVTSKRPGQLSLAHGKQFSTESAAMKVFDKVAIESPRGTKVTLNRRSKTVVISVEMNLRTTSVSV